RGADRLDREESRGSAEANQSGATRGNQERHGARSHRAILEADRVYRRNAARLGREFHAKLGQGRLHQVGARFVEALRETLMSLQEELQGLPPANLAVEDVSKWFRTSRQTVHALDHISLNISEGEFVCLVGPSGCGKSTLLDIIAGLAKPDEGRVMADNEPVLNPGRHRLVMFQESALFPWLNVTGNVMFGLKLKPGLRNKERLEVAKFFLQL